MIFSDSSSSSSSDDEIEFDDAALSNMVSLGAGPRHQGKGLKSSKKIML